MEKAGLNNFKPEIDDLLLEIEKEAVSSYSKKSAKKESKNEKNKTNIEIKDNDNNNLNLNNLNEEEDIQMEKNLIKNK